ncbi:hypothetical protein RJ55_06793 [Drechmeria coniospora]|nr:hypothetical protein RJ55_06793 [Drechmeria coniospora]
MPPTTTAPTAHPALHPTLFDGDPVLFSSWSLEIQAKIELEGASIGNDKTQFFYVFGRLGPNAKKMLAAWIECEHKTGNFNYQRILQRLEQIYGDPNRAEKALKELSQLRQAVTFAKFLPTFENTLLEAGGSNWPEVVKIQFLENALRDDLRHVLIPITDLSRDDFHSFTRQVGIVASRLELLTYHPFHRPTSYNTGEVKPTIQQADLTEPARIQQANLAEGNELLRGKRAQYISAAELSRRKRVGVCFRCARKGCHTKICPLLPPTPPSPLRRDAGATDFRGRRLE